MAKRTPTRPDSPPSVTPAPTKAKAPRRAASVAPAAAPKAPRAKKPAAVEPGDYQPTFEEIATRAYFRSLERGGSGGSDFDNWVAAEADLKEMHAAARAVSKAPTRARRAAKQPGE